MAKTIRRRNNKNITSRVKPSIKSFEKEITRIFLEMLIIVKLYHWKTYSYATHKATDELYSELNSNIDNFIEVLLGKTGNRIDLTKQKTLSLVDLNSQEQIKSKVEGFKKYLVNLNNKKEINSSDNSDLMNIRDEILATLNKFLYLLTLK